MPNYQRSEIDAILSQGRRDITTLSGPAVDAFVSAFRHNLNLLITRYNELDEQAKAGSKTADQLRRDLLPIRKQAEADFLYWQNVAAGTLDDAVRASWAAGVGMAGSLLDIKGAATFKLGTFDRLAYEAQYIATQSGPVRRLLDSIAVDSADKAVDVLRNAMMEGINPRKTAKRLAQVVSADLTRCEVIARTERAGAHKEGTLARYMEADVEYVRWMSAEQMRTCPACWAMDGRVYAIDKVPNDHPNGRCVTEPMLDEEVEEARDDLGADWGNRLWHENLIKNTGIMSKMSDDQLMHIFGSQRQIDAFRAGAPLQDAVKMVSNKTWGTSPSVQALKHPGTSTKTAPTTKPLVTPKPPVAPPPPKPVVDWKRNLPDEWTPCDVKTAQQRINDMLSVNDHVWGTTDTPSRAVTSWAGSDKLKTQFIRQGRCVIGDGLDVGAVNTTADMIFRYCKMCDELDVARPAYFNIGATTNKNYWAYADSGITVYKGAYTEGKVGNTMLQRNAKTGEVKYVYKNFPDRLAFHPHISKTDADFEPFMPLKSTVDHELGHFLGSMFSVGEGDEILYISPGVTTTRPRVLSARLMHERQRKVLGVSKSSGITGYAKKNLNENLAETWQAFVEYGRDGVGTKAADRFDKIGWTQAAQRAGVIKWK